MKYGHGAAILFFLIFPITLHAEGVSQLLQHCDKLLHEDTINFNSDKLLAYNYLNVYSTDTENNQNSRNALSVIYGDANLRTDQENVQAFRQKTFDRTKLDVTEIESKSYVAKTLSKEGAEHFNACVANILDSSGVFLTYDYNITESVTITVQFKGQDRNALSTIEPDGFTTHVRIHGYNDGKDIEELSGNKGASFTLPYVISKTGNTPIVVTAYVDYNGRPTNFSDVLMIPRIMKITPGQQHREIVHSEAVTAVCAVGGSSPIPGTPLRIPSNEIGYLANAAIESINWAPGSTPSANSPTITIDKPEKTGASPRLITYHTQCYKDGNQFGAQFTGTISAEKVTYDPVEISF